MSGMPHRASPPSARTPRAARRHARLRASGRQTFDSIDVKILETLRRRGRITNQALSEIVGLSARPTLERVRRLEAAGVIQGYSALLDPEAVGHEIIALAEIVMRDPSVGSRQRLEGRLLAHPSVVELQVVNGEADYHVRFVAASLGEYEALTDELISERAYGIARIKTAFVLKTLKPFSGYPVAIE
jgi:DNA-binding Lrp family transcriptional regulator